MSKCWYCNNELTSGDSPKHFGICNKCYDEMFKSGDTIIRSLTNKIAELQKQLEEKEKEIYNYRNYLALNNEAYNQLLEEYNERISEKKQSHILNDRLGEKIKGLENQIKSQPAEIVEKIRKEVGLKLKYKLNDEVCVLKICNQINEVLDTILKEYQK